jgi:hypothetical protein
VTRARRLLGWSAALLLLASASCASERPAPRPMGAAKRALEVRQTANPEASEKATEAQGTPATTAAEILNNYHTNQKTEVQERRQDRQRDRGISEVGQEN